MLAGSTIEEEVLGDIARLTSTQSFFKNNFGAKSGFILHHTYLLVEGVIHKASELLKGSVNEMSARVVGAIGEKDPLCHESMWSMVLRFVKVK